MSAALGEQSFREVSLTPRNLPTKPVRFKFNPLIHESDTLVVKFRDDLRVRVRGGLLTDNGTGDLAPAQHVLQRLAGAGWSPSHRLQETKLDQLRAGAQDNLRRAVADLNTEFILKLPPGINAADTCDALNLLEIVELAEPMPQPAPLTLPPDFVSMQGYLTAPTSGINAQSVWSLPGGTGAGIKLVDIEYNWNFSHHDLPPTTLLGPAIVDPFGSTNHGTAVLGQIGSLDNGWGTKGIAYDCTLYVAAANTSAGYNVAAAITSALGTLGPGDVILIEQQYFGPNYTGSPPGTQFGLVPSEWLLSVYNATITAVGNGVTVVAAAGNGSQNLDDPVYNQGHAPFLAGNDSGAIIVGAGAAPAAHGGSDTDRSRLWYSNYGSRVNVQGWGERVTTTGYGTLFNSEGENRWYTMTFSGTSSASPIVAGACVLLQSAYLAQTSSLLSPGQIRDALVATGTPQQSGTFPATQNIGPRPDALAALQSIASCQGCRGDLNSDDYVNAMDIHEFSHCFISGPAVSNGCECADINVDGQVDLADSVLLVDELIQATTTICPS